MKISLMKILSAVFLLTAISISSHAQTNVSGGIYSNATWTLAGSPYIVVDTVVVFPGVTLTIQPGVVVRFANNKFMEIRQASLIAIGTSVDSITFTSNSGTPTPGIWKRIYLNDCVQAHFNFCNFYYSTDGALGYSTSGPPFVTFKNSNFRYNINGHSAYWCIVDTCSFYSNTNGCANHLAGSVNFCRVSNNQTGLNIGGAGPFPVTNCTINSNQTGIIGTSQVELKNCIIDSNTVAGISGTTDTIQNCQIKHNGIGINISNGFTTIIMNVIDSNVTGIKLGNSGSDIYCNRICNNTAYDLQYSVAFGNNTSVANNYWCTPDSLSTTARIYDGYDNISLGLVNFMPLDVSNCYLTGCNLSVTANVINATCDTCHTGSATAMVTNGFPPYIYTWLTSPIQTTQTATGLASGTYTVCVTDGHGCTACNSNVFVDSTNCTGFSVNAQSTNATCASCTDGTATANVFSGTPPYSYTWYTSPVQTTQTATGLGQGSYAVCVTDLYGCVACDTVTVGVGNCSAQFNLYPDTILHHYFAVNMASGVPPLSYSWNWGDGSPVDTIPYPSHTYAAAGFYTICLSITDSVGCTDTHCTSYYLTRMEDAMVYVNVVSGLPTGIVNPGDNNFFFVFPNPAFSNLSIGITGNVVAAEGRIYNMLGEIKLTSVITNQRADVDISALSPGAYFVEIISENKTGRKMFIKQ